MSFDGALARLIGFQVVIPASCVSDHVLSRDAMVRFGATTGGLLDP